MIDLVVARLKAEVDALRTVGSTADLASVVEGRVRHALPAAYVHPIADAAGPNRLVNAVSQNLTRRIGVLLVVAAQGEARAADAPDLLEPLYAATRAALVGWQPDADHEPMHFGRGAMVRVAEGTAWWLEELTTETEVRAT
jgi:hypothetical protein